MEENSTIPDYTHMSLRARNERLYKVLVDMGVTVFPVFENYFTPEIRSISHFIVSTGDGGDLAKSFQFPITNENINSSSGTSSK